MSDLTLNELQLANDWRDKEWDPQHKLDYMFHAVELGGEVGELLNMVKKIKRANLGLPGSTTTREALELEFGDAQISLALLANSLGVDLEESTRKAFNKSSDKHNFKTRL